MKKIPIQSRFGILARQSLGANPLQVRAIHIVSALYLTVKVLKRAFEKTNYSTMRIAHTWRG